MKGERDMTRSSLDDTGERMIPAGDDEVSFVYARHEFAYRHVAQFVSCRQAIDVGCGTGYGTALLARTATFVEGVDYSAEAIAFCNSHYAASNILFRQSRAEELSSDRRFDVAVSFQVIEHLQDTDGFLQRLSSVVRPGGTIFLTTPNARAVVREKDANPFHHSEMNHGQMEQLLTAHFRSFELLGIGYRSPNLLRSVLQNSPLYRIGKYFGRRNPIKKIARGTMRLTDFAVLRSNVARDAIDLFAVCTNNS
jgi:2-polyprenyl-3-methyl-5-hydroxy-6-metoxy-1,4-benzoquinol methylase